MLVTSITMMTYTDSQIKDINDYAVFRAIADFAELARAIHRQDKEGAKHNIAEINDKIADLNRIITEKI